MHIQHQKTVAHSFVFDELGFAPVKVGGNVLSVFMENVKELIGITLSMRITKY